MRSLSKVIVTALVLVAAPLTPALALRSGQQVTSADQSTTAGSCGFTGGECCSNEICLLPGFCKEPSGTCYNCPCPGECPVACPSPAPALSWPMLSLLILLLMGGGLYLARLPFRHRRIR